MTVTRVRVTRMWESCERTTFYVELTNSAGETITPTANATGSVYTNGEGLSVDEARDRALIEALTWAAFLGLEAEPYEEDGVRHEASMELHSYGHRAPAFRKVAKNPALAASYKPGGVSDFAVGDCKVKFYKDGGA